MNTYYPLVSCIIPSYKRCETLQRAIDSVLKQTYSNIEVLIVDDNIPNDEYSNSLREIIKQYDDARVKLVTQKVHINGAVARNEGVKASSGEYIAFLDDDDEWLPDKVERQLRILKSDTGLSGIGGGVTLWCGGKEISKLPKKEITEEKLLLKVLIREVGLATSSFLCKKEAFIEMGGFDPTLKRSQDLQLFTDFLHKFRIYPVWDFRTVKMHIESSMNRLDAQKLASNKKEFFNSVDDVIKSFSKSEQRRIKSAHYYEVAFVALKEHKFLFAIKFLLLGLASPKSIVDLYKRYKER